jgi:hypothetical protein
MIDLDELRDNTLPVKTAGKPAYQTRAGHLRSSPLLLCGSKLFNTVITVIPGKFFPETLCFMNKSNLYAGIPPHPKDEGVSRK